MSRRDEPRPAAIALMGPTAAGKSLLGLELARRFERPILVCDSVKVYRGLDIGSAKPTAAMRADVEHRLIDLVDPDQPFSAGDYQAHAWQHIDRGPTLFVGGTGLYLRATAWTQTGAEIEGVGADRNEGERARFEARWSQREAADPGCAYRALLAEDPETARSIHPNNRVRVLRALWLCRVHGRPVSAARRQDPPRCRLRLCLVVFDPGPRALELRIERRVDAMLRAGWLAEVENLRAAGYDARHKAMHSLGYRQLLEVVEGEAELEAARQRIIVATRQYSRRQRSYFRSQLPADKVIHLQRPEQCPWEQLEAFLRGES